MDAVNGQLVTPDGMGIEALNDIQVAQKRSQSPLEAVDLLETQLARAVPAFTPLQDEPYASTEAALLDLGMYPLHAIVDMFTFDSRRTCATTSSRRAGQSRGTSSRWMRHTSAQR
jgi:hypothetical protein